MSLRRSKWSIVLFTAMMVLVMAVSAQAYREGQECAYRGWMPGMPEPNTLTEAEKAAGWILLYDGGDELGPYWRGFRSTTPPAGWKAMGGCIVRISGGGDLMTVFPIENFELKLEWAVEPGGNSGIIWRVNPNIGGAPYETGPEMQILDDVRHADGSNPLTSAGSDYGMYARPDNRVVYPPYEFNRVHIIVNGAHVTYYLNDIKVVEYELWSDDWYERLSQSKFTAWPGYGMQKEGHIVLQDHGDIVWFRNIKIRQLP